MINAGWFDATSMPLVFAMAFAFGGTAQFCAGLLELPRANTFGFTAFCAYGAFWWSFALYVAVFGGKAQAAFVGWYLFIWGVFTFMMWIGTFRANRGAQLIFLALWITFMLLALADWTGNPMFRMAGGYGGLVTPLFAIYVAAAEVINETRGVVVLPLGPYQGPV